MEGPPEIRRGLAEEHAILEATAKLLRYRQEQGPCEMAPAQPTTQQHFHFKLTTPGLFPPGSGDKQILTRARTKGSSEVKIRAQTLQVQPVSPHSSHRKPGSPLHLLRGSGFFSWQRPKQRGLKAG